jgi:N-acetylglutamate synthase-like GNAT family acetyltransferase
MDNGYHHLPPGKIAAVVTYLEMTARPPVRPSIVAGFALRRLLQPDLNAYRALFRRVGEDWLWFSRLSMDDAALEATIRNDCVEVSALERNGQEIGLLELDFRTDDVCELAYLGVTADTIGSGAGRFLMTAAIERAWSRLPRIKRFFVHTCTLDHPGALAFYQRSGFKPYGRAVEIADDPRLDGRLPRAAAASVPLL